MNNDFQSLLSESDSKFIKNSLKIDISSVKLQQNRFGINNDILIADSQENKYVIKVYADIKANREYEGLEELGKYLLVPKPIYKSSTGKFIIMDFVEGNLLIERYEQIEKKGNFGKAEEALELYRNKILSDMYSQTVKSIEYKDYIDCYSNNLFYNRLFGKRFEDFYHSSQDNIYTFFDKKIILNGKQFNYSINEIFDDIKNRYKKSNPQSCSTVLGHGDSHCWNILIDKHNKPVFIDPEFYGNLPIFMEYAKPYYSDFLGSLFYHFPHFLDKYFRIKTFKETNRSIELKIGVEERMKFRVMLTQAKADSLSKMMSMLKKPYDFLEFRDYLIMSHALARDPNKFEKNVQVYFLSLFPILYSFDFLDVNSFYSFF